MYLALMKAKGKNGFSQAWRRPHALPLPPMAQTVVRRALELSRSDSIWLFPQTKRRYAADALDSTCTSGTLSSQLEYLQEPGKPLHSDRPFASHTIRKSFSTHLSQKRGKECPHGIRRLVPRSLAVELLDALEAAEYELVALGRSSVRYHV